MVGWKEPLEHSSSNDQASCHVDLCAHSYCFIQMEQAEQRMKILRHDIEKIKKQQTADSDDDDDDLLDDTEALQAELDELQAANAKRQAKLDEYEKNKKWNVDNLGHVVADKTEISATAGKKNYTASGFVPPKPDDLKPTKQVASSKSHDAEDAAVEASTTTTSSKTLINAPSPADRFKKEDLGVIEAYPQFCDKYADLVEEFMKIPDLNGSRDFLLNNAEVLLQENASNYLLLAALEDEMNGRQEAMKLTARQSQIITNIAELAKTVDTHPGNVIMPFFKRMEERVHLEEFLAGVKAFQEKIIQRAVVKRQEIDAQREAESKNLEDIPREQRLGPGGLDPLEVIETLPNDMVRAFESRDVDQLKEALMKLEPEEAEYHMKRCVDSGLWNAGG
jgi:cell division cycle protein 37